MSSEERPDDAGDISVEGPAADRWARLVMWATVAVAIVPIATAVIRAIAEGWLPIGDNAYFAIRSRDVLTEHHPLLGAWSSGSVTIDTNVNNLGPLQLDLFAPFTKLSPGAGTAIAVGLTHALAIVGIALVANRLAGRLVACSAMLVCAWLGWLMGSSALVEPRQHPYLVFVVLCLFMLAWALADGHPWALPWALLVGSLIVQTQFAYGFIAGLVAAGGLVGFGVVTWRVRVAGGACWSEHRRRTVRALWVAAGIAGVLWAQPIAEQLVGDGNLVRVATTPGSGEHPSVGEAVRLVASIVTTPGRWVRPAFGAYDPDTTDLATLAASLVGLAILAVLLVLALTVARRRRVRTATVGTATAIWAVVAALITSRTIPFTPILGFTSDNSRWLWPLTGFVAVVLIGQLIDVLTERLVVSRGSGATTEHPRWAIPAVAVPVAAFAAANLPSSPTYTTPLHAPERVAIAKRLVDQIDADELGDVVMVDRSGSYFGEPYSYPVILRLQELGVEFTFDAEQSPVDLHRFGESRADDGRATHRLEVTFGAEALEPPADGARAAYVPGLDAGEEDELAELGPRAAGHLQSGDLTVDLDEFDPEGLVARTIETALTDDDVDPATLSSALAAADEDGALTIDAGAGADVEADLDRFMELGRRQRFDTVAVDLSPIGDGS